jgi:hypothetical protein
MTRLTDAFEALADRGAPRGPDRVLPAARARATQMRRRRLVAMGGLAAAAVVVAAAGLVAAGGDGGTRVESGLAATTDAPAPTAAPTSGPASSAPVHASATTEPAPATSAPGGPTVQVHFLVEDESDCAVTRAVERPVEGPAVLRAALDALLAGPTAEEQAAGALSGFSAATAGGVRSVDIRAGVALVDLRADVLTAMPGVSTSCGSAALFAQLDGTVLQFDGVDRAVYSLAGDVAAFYESLEGSAPDGSSSTPEADGTPAWPGTVAQEPGGAVGLGDFPDHLAQVDPDHRLGMEDVASLLLHLEDARAEGTLVHVETLFEDDGRRGLVVTLAALADDSVAEVAYELWFDVAVGQGSTLVSVTWTQRCQPGRGPQEPTTDLCV